METHPPPPLEILYQDDWLVAVDKPAGQIVHPSDLPQATDLITMKILRDQVGCQVQAVHRLDRPTTGVLLFAKGRTITRALSRAFERHQVQKTYHAIVDGVPLSAEWRCEEPIQKSPDHPAREAATTFRVLTLLPGGLTHIEAKPHSGRYHQIRRHLLHCGFPIVGDYRYAGFDRSEELSTSLGLETRMLLQSQRLTFPHPITKERTTVEVPIDPFFKKIIGEQANNPQQ